MLRGCCDETAIVEFQLEANGRRRLNAAAASVSSSDHDDDDDKGTTTSRKGGDTTRRRVNRETSIITVDWTDDHAVCRAAARR